MVTYQPKFKNHVLGIIFGVFAMLFFGLILVILLRKIIENKPGLIINSEGVIDNSSGLSAGLVLWSDILSISTTNVTDQKFIVFIVKNPEEYISRQKGIFKRGAMKFNYRFYGSPINISANTLNTNFDKLFELLNQKFEEHIISKKHQR